MFAVIFTVQPKPSRFEEYLALAKALKPELEGIEGFIDAAGFFINAAHEELRGSVIGIKFDGTADFLLGFLKPMSEDVNISGVRIHDQGKWVQHQGALNLRQCFLVASLVNEQMGIPLVSGGVARI